MATVCYFRVFVILEILSRFISLTTPRAATHWKLQTQPDGQALVVPVEDDFAKVASEDPVLSILLAEKYGFGNVEKGETAEKSEECFRCDEKLDSDSENSEDSLTCKGHSNKSQYDSLAGIRERDSQSFVPEPEVALIFKRKETDTLDMGALEQTLREAIEASPNSLSVLNQVGNYWRVKGSTSLAIECFRKALIINPNHPDVLLNLARVLFNLQYKEDALMLAEKSLQFKNSDQNTWLQHFTLGEIYQAMSRYEDAGYHFKHVLDLNPHFQPAERHLQQLGQGDAHLYNATLYTILIIMVLFVSVFLVLYMVTEVFYKDSELGIVWERPKGAKHSKKNGSC